MAIYRSDQAQLTFAFEAAQGGDLEMMEGELETSSAGATTLSTAVKAGGRSVTVASASNFVEGSQIRIGTVAGTASETIAAHEVRRIENINGTTFVLDRPLGFNHAASQEVKEVKGVGGASDIINDGDKYITWIPGVYETIDTPDPQMSIEGRRFLGTTSKRRWNTAYSGQQSLVGGVGGITLINGWPLRFPIGSVVTTPSDTVGTTLTLVDATVKGDVYVHLSASTSLEIGDYINIDDGSSTLSEIRKIIAKPLGGDDKYKLNYPLHFPHAALVSVDEVAHSSSIVYTHVIQEETHLDTVSWHVHIRDSDETSGNTKDFNRRYVGGMIGSSTLSAEEGGMLTQSWDSVNFLDMVHNQQNSNVVSSSSLYTGASPQSNMPRFSLMQNIDAQDIGEPSHKTTGNSAAANDATGYPTTQPYYFSQGTIKFYNTTIAKIVNFSLSISNGEEPRYYISQLGKRNRGPYEIMEGPRDYSMTASVVLPDVNETSADTTPSLTNATELFKQLLLEGDYDGSIGKRGFSATLQFTRGTDDYIYIDIPTSSTAGAPTQGNAGAASDVTADLNKQGMFILSASHSIGEGAALQADLDMMLRGIKITIKDNVPIYP